MAEDSKDWARAELQRLGAFDWNLADVLEPVLNAAKDAANWYDIKQAILGCQSPQDAFLVIQERAAEATVYFNQDEGEWRKEALSQINQVDIRTRVWVADLINKVPDQDIWKQTLEALSRVHEERLKRAAEDESKASSQCISASNKPERDARFLVDRKDFNYLPRSIKQDMPENIKQLPELVDQFTRFERTDALAKVEALTTRFPHGARAISGLLKGIERNWGLGSNIIQLQPTILVGEPGVGKSKLAREFGKLLGLRTHTVSVAGYRDANIFGVSAGWGTAMPSIMTSTVADAKVLNPVILMDEIDKVRDTKNGAIHSELLALLEFEEAKTYRERYLATSVDASYINWIFTANDLENVPAPLLSRCAVYNIPQPTMEQLPQIIRSLVIDYATENGLRAEFFQLDIAEVEALVATYVKHGSVRILGRLVREYLHVKGIARA